MTASGLRSRGEDGGAEARGHGRDAGRPSRRPGVLAKSPSVILGISRGADVLTILLAALAAYRLRHGDFGMPERYLLATALCMLLAAQYFHLAGLYDLKLLDRIRAQLLVLSPAWAAVVLTLIAAAFFGKVSEDFSRAWTGLWLALSFLGFLALRLGLAFRIRAWQAAGLMTRNVAVVGAGAIGQRLVDHLRIQPALGVRLVGVFDDRRTRIPEGAVGGVALRGTVDDLMRIAREEEIDSVIIALPGYAEDRIMRIVEKVRLLPVRVELCPDQIGFRFRRRAVEAVDGLPMLTVSDRPIAGWSWIWKAMEDRLLAALFLVLAAPVMAAIAIAIRIESPGPVLFRQRRYGFNNEVFTVYKFRTMHAEHGADERAPQARRHDPRVTRVGAFLRRTSLDELPQLVNVLEGRMSIVGPRPHAIAHDEYYAKLIAEYLGRHRVKPGMTGWAQIHGLRGETETADKMAERVEYDLYYIDHWSLWLDLKIIAMTLVSGFVHENAF